ncbi:MAG: hypothetical protein JSS81_17765 [Acidobacteria bacterium]|nr:hypothetical protein [Acidobacteriota bacterium]
MIRWIALLTLGVVLFWTADARAQTKKRLVFKKKYAELTAVISGSQVLEYVFRVGRNADTEIWIDHTDAAADYPKFVLYRPDGKLFYDRDSVNYGPLTDLMDILPLPGDYTLRLQLPAESRDGDKPVKFTLRILLK